MKAKCVNGSWVHSHICQLAEESQDVYFTGYVPIVIGILGVIFNLLTIVVLGRINKKNYVMKIIMTSIAVSDSVEIVNYIMSDCLNGIIPDLHDHPYQKFRHNNLFWSVPFQAMTMTFNRWLVLLLTCNNWLIMKDACNLKKYDKRMRGKRFRSVIVTIAVLGIAAVLANIPLIHQFVYKKCTAFMAGDEGIKIEVAPEACDPRYLWGYLTGFILGINTLVPATLQILMNGYIIKVLVGFKSVQTNVVKSNGNKQDSETRIMRMCSTVALVYLALQIPYIILTVEGTRLTVVSCRIRACQREYCECYAQRRDNCPSTYDAAGGGCYAELNTITDTRGISLKQTILPFSTLGLILNCSINMFIYLLTSPNFRKEFSYILHLDRLEDLVTSRSQGTGETGLPTNATVSEGQDNIRMQTIRE